MMACPRGDERAGMRAALIAGRRSLPARAVRELSARIADGLRALDAYRCAGRVMCYAAVRGEVGTEEIIRECMARGARVAMPRCDRSTGRVEARWIRDPDADLRPGLFGIPEPRPWACAEAPPGEIELFIVPGVGFDIWGARLGWGRGLYDEFLAGAPPSSTKVGLAYEMQVAPRVPVRPGDVPVDAVVTEERAIDCRRIRDLLDRVKRTPPRQCAGGRRYHEP